MVVGAADAKARPIGTNRLSRVRDVRRPFPNLFLLELVSWRLLRVFSISFADVVVVVVVVIVVVVVLLCGL